MIALALAAFPLRRGFYFGTVALGSLTVGGDAGGWFDSPGVR